jgi:hypothetical protein
VRIGALTIAAVVAAITGGLAHANAIQVTVTGNITSAETTVYQVSATPDPALVGTPVILSLTYDPAELSSYYYLAQNSNGYYTGEDYDLQYLLSGVAGISTSISFDSQELSYNSIYDFAFISLQAFPNPPYFETSFNWVALNANGGFLEPTLYTTSVWSPGQIDDQAAMDAIVSGLVDGSVRVSYGDDVEEDLGITFTRPQASTPEPSTPILFGSGLFCLGLWAARNYDRPLGLGPSLAARIPGGSRVSFSVGPGTTCPRPSAQAGRR